MTVDFVPPELAGGFSTRPISEATIVAMYMNNRAAEALTEGHVDDAYWWARAAIGEAPRFFSAYNTLGVVYQRHGNLPEAEQVLAYALEREPANTRDHVEPGARARSDGAHERSEGPGRRSSINWSPIHPSAIWSVA